MIDVPDNPRDFVAFLLSPHIKDGNLAFQPRDLDGDKFIDDLGIRIIEVTNERCYFDISNEQAETLLWGALSNKQVAEYASFVAAINLTKMGPLPAGLRLFASQKLTGNLPKGKQGRKRGGNYQRDYWIWGAVNSLSHRFGLSKTRNEDQKQKIPSACDYVAGELTKFGGPDFDRVVDIYFEMNKFLKSPDALDPKKEIARALTRSSREN